MQDQGLAPAQDERDDLVEKQMPDGRLRRTRRRTALHFFAIVRDQKVGLLWKVKQVVLAQVCEAEPYPSPNPRVMAGSIAIPGRPVMKPPAVARERVSRGDNLEAAVRVCRGCFPAIQATEHCFQ